MKLCSLLTLGIGLLVVVAMICYKPEKAFFSSVCVCRTCGVKEVSNKWFWVEKQTLEETRLSSTVARVKLIGSHEHQFLFAHGGGGNLTCAIGHGRHLLSIVDDRNFSEVLINVYRVYGAQTGMRLLQQSLDPEQSYSIMGAFGDLNESRVESDEEFKGWMEERIKLLSETFGVEVLLKSER